MTINLALATTTEDPRDPLAWSGTPHAILSALERLDGVHTHILGPLDPGPKIFEGMLKVYWALRSKRFMWEREPGIQRRYAAQLASKLKALDYDFVLTLGSMSAAALPDSVPYVLYGDSTFELLVDYYPRLSRICSRSRRYGEAIDQKAFSGARHIVMTSTWAADSVINHYKVPSERVSVIPIGAQHICRQDPAELESRWQSRLNGPMRLLWIGVEWERKGGDIAVAIASELHRRGIPVQLDLAGLTPSAEVVSLPFVKAHGFVDARTQKSKLEDFFLSSFALLLPSRADCTSVVIADSASYGQPSFVSDTGGMRSMVIDGVNGEVIPSDAPASTYADALVKYWKDPPSYLDLARASRSRYETVLSWDVAVPHLLKVATTAVKESVCL